MSSSNPPTAQQTSGFAGQRPEAPPQPQEGRRRRRRPPSPRQRRVNVGNTERNVSLAAGSLLTILGLSRRSVPGLLIAGVGGAMLYRGATGKCPMYSSLGVDTAHDDSQRGVEEQVAEKGTHVTESYLIARSAEELYGEWRNLDNLPRIMTHLESVRVLDDRRSHWVAKAPGIAGGSVAWDAEITEDDRGRRLAWRSLPGADVVNAGSVDFVPALGDRGTIVRVTLDYVPPAGQVGRWIAKLFGEEPQQQIREDLRRFKRMIETGEVISIKGQPRGTCGGGGKRERK